jgi:chemotaxis protein MotB
MKPPSDEQPRRRVVVRKRTGYTGHNPRLGVWKLAYADFVTAMMAFFMVMWLLTQSDLRLRSQIAMYFRNPGVLPGGAAINEELNAVRGREPRVVSNDLTVVQGEGEDQLLRGRAKEIREAVAHAGAEPELAGIAQQVHVEVMPAGLVIEVVDEGRTMLFDLSSAELKPRVVEALRKVAPALAKLPNRIQIGGHTDSRPFPPGSTMTNWQLGFQRADNARRVLVEAGLPPDRIDRVQSFADTEPLVPENPMADENRRLSIVAVRRFQTPPARTGGPITDELRATAKKP